MQFTGKLSIVYRHSIYYYQAFRISRTFNICQVYVYNLLTTAVVNFDYVGG